MGFVFYFYMSISLAIHHLQLLILYRMLNSIYRPFTGMSLHYKSKVQYFNNKCSATLYVHMKQYLIVTHPVTYRFIFNTSNTI